MCAVVFPAQDQRRESVSRDQYRLRASVVEVSRGRDHSDHLVRVLGQDRRPVPARVSRSGDRPAREMRPEAVRVAQSHVGALCR